MTVPARNPDIWYWYVCDVKILCIFFWEDLNYARVRWSLCVAEFYYANLSCASDYWRNFTMWIWGMLSWCEFELFVRLEEFYHVNSFWLYTPCQFCKICYWIIIWKVARKITYDKMLFSGYFFEVIIFNYVWLRGHWVNDVMTCNIWRVSHVIMCETRFVVWFVVYWFRKAIDYID